MDRIDKQTIQCNRTMLRSVNMVSFNCKNVKRSVDTIRKLCQSADIIALQETWLRPDELQYLCEIDERFGNTGTSAMDPAGGIMVGRPWGGVCLMWNKTVFPNVSVVQCDNARVCAIKITLPQKSILVFSVYMPTDKNVNLVEFTDCLSLVSATISNEDIWMAYILGDLNAHPNELFYNEMMAFCCEQMWTCSDIDILGLASDTFSFISEANGSKRWLDHVLTTESAARTVVNVYVKYDVTWSDHYPLCVECNLDVISSDLLCDNEPMINKVIWGERKPEQVAMYNKICHDDLSQIDFPSDLRSCCDNYCYEQGHKHIIDNLYSSIISVLSAAASTCYSVKRPLKNKPVVGWNKYVSEAHKVARDKFNTWVLYGKPRCGGFYDDMQKKSYYL